MDITYGKYRLDQEKFDKLIGVVNDQEKVTLKVLYNAVVKSVNALNVNSSSVSVKEWETTKNAYEDYSGKLWKKHFEQGEEEKALDNILAVVDYLAASGWRIKKSTAYNHHKEGKLRPGDDGKYKVSAVDKYAAVHLKRLDGKGKDAIEKINEEKQRAESRKVKAQAALLEEKLKITQQKYVPRESLDRELVQRAMIFKVDVEAFCRKQVGKIISLVNGDKDRAPDLVEHLLAEAAGWLNRYSADRAFIVPDPSQVAETVLDDPETEELMEDEE